MHMKWILLLFPVSLVVMVTSVFCQSSLLSNAVEGSEHYQSDYARTDTSRISIPADSTFADLNVGWNKQPGQMPVYYPGILPNSMPNLITPLVDEKMIFPVGNLPADSLKSSETDNR